jgi:2-polyprenyl-3-methyl-5-hydroxy-6-metoxy-1,4-benzoquinol methylase
LLLLTGPRVRDAGCGLGRSAAHFLAQGALVTPLDCLPPGADARQYLME